MPLSKHYKSMFKTCGKPLPPTRVYIRYDCSLIWNCISKCKLTPFVRRSFIDFPACRMDRFQSCRWWGWWWYETRLYWLMIDDDMIILLWFCYDPMMILWWSYDDFMMILWRSYNHWSHFFIATLDKGDVCQPQHRGSKTLLCPQTETNKTKKKTKKEENRVHSSNWNKGWFAG